MFASNLGLLHVRPRCLVATSGELHSLIEIKQAHKIAASVNDPFHSNNLPDDAKG
jgi:hypothetical protein